MLEMTLERPLLSEAWTDPAPLRAWQCSAVNLALSPGAINPPGLTTLFLFFSFFAFDLILDTPKLDLISL